MTEVKTDNAVEVQAESVPVETEVEAVETAKVELPEKYLGKSIEDVAKMHMELEKKLGEKIPSAPESYVLPEEFDLSRKDEFLSKAKELNVTQEQLKELSDILILDKRDSEVSVKHNEEISLKESEKALQDYFGNNLDIRTKEIQETSIKYAGEEITKELDSLGAFKNPTFMKFMDKINSAVLKETMVGADYINRPKTASEAENEINSLRMDEDFMKSYRDKFTPGHKEAVKKMSELYRIAHS